MLFCSPLTRSSSRSPLYSSPSLLCVQLYTKLRKTGKDARAAAKALGDAFVDEYAKKALENAAAGKNKKAANENEGILYEVDLTSEFAIFEILKKRILLAGARIAIVMNHILQVTSSIRSSILYVENMDIHIYIPIAYDALYACTCPRKYVCLYTCVFM